MQPIPGSVFNLEDWLVVALFIAVMLVIVLYAMRSKARSGQDYFLSSRDSNWVQIGTSIFSSNIGSEHLVGEIVERAGLGRRAHARVNEHVG